MGAFMKEDDIYIGTFLDLFNVRFGPTPPFGLVEQKELVYGGIEEMAALQQEFRIFRIDRPFSESAAVLGLGGIYNARAKNRWFKLLRNLPDDGDQLIADALVAHFKREPLLPCYMTSHLPKSEAQNKVKIKEDDTPIDYMEQKYLTISLPMYPKSKPPAKKAAKKRK